MLPSPPQLEQICKGLATLDAMLSPEWEHRYYSFNAAWSPGQRMASMRNGEGDEWFIVFEPGGVFLKAFWHEHPNADQIYTGLPPALMPHLQEAAFSMQHVTFGGWHDGAWTLRGNAAPMVDELAILSGDPSVYRAYAAAYFEADVPLAAIAHVLAGKPLNEDVVRMITDLSLDALTDDLAEIAY